MDKLIKEIIPKVTIGIPTYNRKKYLKEALDSIVKQDYPNIEIIVSDNASQDGTESFMQEYMSLNAGINLVYLRNDCNLGPSANWQNCIDNAKGEYCLILSDDDVLTDGAVKKMVTAFNSDVVIVIGNTQYINANGKIFGKHCNPAVTLDCTGFWEARLKKGFHDTPSAVMYRTKLGQDYFKKLPQDNSAMDMALDLMMSECGKVVCLSDFVVKYRIHAGNDTNNIYRCASSHKYLYDYFLKGNYSLEKMEWLKDYCRNNILGAAFLVLRKNFDINLARRLLDLLPEGLSSSWLMIYWQFCLYIIKSPFRKIKRMFLQRLLE